MAQPPVPANTPFLLYSDDDEKVHVRVLVHGETLWLPLAQIAQLFAVQTPAISKHLKNIFESGELDREATVSKMETVQTKGVRSVQRSIDYYNLDAFTGQTAAEIIHAKADHNAPYMGLLTWKNAPHGRVLASDVTVAKNYFGEPEIT